MIFKQTHFICFVLYTSFWLFSCGQVKQSFISEDISAQHEFITTNRSLSQIMTEHNDLTVKERIALYYRIKSNSSAEANGQNEAELNIYGYSLLWGNKISEAIAIFQLVVSEYPESSNAYDSLAEAYLKNGENEQALINYKKSLALNPDNFNAEDQIDYIKYPDRKRDTPTEHFAKIYTRQAYHDDIDQLANKLAELHPNAFKFIAEADFWQLVNDIKSKITDSTTYGEFAWHCNEIIASVNCSHTSTGGFFYETEMLPEDLLFPIEVRWIQDRLYAVQRINNDNQSQAFEEIISINGMAAAELISDIYRHIPSQGYIDTYKRYRFNESSRSMIAYALGFPTVYKIELKNQVCVVPITTDEVVPFKETFKRPCPQDLCFKILADSITGVLTVSSFNYYRWNNFTQFQEFIDRSFQEINEKGIQNLIIDVRFNGGGSPESSVFLLKYLLDQPFIYFEKSDYPAGQGIQVPFKNRFKGAQYYLIDGNGNSTTGHFMALVKASKIGTIIGEELGSNQFCTGGQLTLRLTNTKLNYYVANTTSSLAPQPFSDDRGIFPDYEVTQNVYEYLNNIDRVKDFAIQMINDKAAEVLAADSTWSREIFHFPIPFAASIKYQGIEDARFPMGWGNKDSNSYWSYAFAWDILRQSTVEASELENNLKLYFDGLMNIESTEVQIKEVSNMPNSNVHEGIIHTTNTRGGYKEALELSVRIEQRKCVDRERLILLFRFSPREFKDKVWDKLHEVKIKDGVCTG